MTTPWFTLLSFVPRLRCLFPSRLPIGMKQFVAWCDRVVSVYGLPDNDSTRFTLASMILHSPPTGFYRPMEFYGRSVLKAMSNQVACQVMQDLKDKQAKEIALAKEIEEQNQKAAVTDSSEGTADESTEKEELPNAAWRVVSQARRKRV